MSKLHDLLQNLSTDADLKAQYLENPEQVMEAAGLNEEEKEAMRSGDEKSLTDLTGDKQAYGKHVMSSNNNK